jgi:hypothetical protein
LTREFYNDTQVIFITIVAIYIALAEKIGTPLIKIHGELGEWRKRRDDGGYLFCNRRRLKR